MRAQHRHTNPKQEQQRRHYCHQPAAHHPASIIPGSVSHASRELLTWQNRSNPLCHLRRFLRRESAHCCPEGARLVANTSPITGASFQTRETAGANGRYWRALIWSEVHVLRSSFLSSQQPCFNHQVKRMLVRLMSDHNKGKYAIDERQFLCNEGNHRTNWPS